MEKPSKNTATHNVAKYMALQYITLLGCFLIGLAAVSQVNGEDHPGVAPIGLNFDNRILDGADLSDMILKGASFRNASLKNANFKGADLTNANWGGADLTGADLRETVGLVANGNLSKANLEGATFYVGYSVKFRAANMKKCKFAGVVGACAFSGADLRGANLRGAQFDASDRFRNAIYDDDTSWPDGFDFKAAGAVLSKSDEKNP